jgi:hypothetical protein
MEEVAAHRARFRLYTLLVTQGMQSDPRNIYLNPMNEWCRGVAVFNGYTSSRGPDISITESRKNCEINIDIQYPNGVQYSPVSVGYSGFANMDDGVQGLHKTTYYFSGSMRLDSMYPDSRMLTRIQVATKCLLIIHLWAPPVRHIAMRKRLIQRALLSGRLATAQHPLMSTTRLG